MQRYINTATGAKCFTCLGKKVNPKKRKEKCPTCLGLGLDTSRCPKCYQKLDDCKCELDIERNKEGEFYDPNIMW